MLGHAGEGGGGSQDADHLPTGAKESLYFNNRCGCG